LLLLFYFYISAVLDTLDTDTYTVHCSGDVTDFLGASNETIMDSNEAKGATSDVVGAYEAKGATSDVVGAYEAKGAISDVVGAYVAQGSTNESKGSTNESAYASSEVSGGSGTPEPLFTAESIFAECPGHPFSGQDLPYDWICTSCSQDIQANTIVYNCRVCQETVHVACGKRMIEQDTANLYPNNSPRSGN